MTERLPIYDILAETQQTLAEQNTLILQAPPGAGKSTVLPLELLDAPWLNGQKIILLEPRRLAARGVAARMAGHRNEEIGETVGYRVRFENRVSKQTRIEVLTEGILTRMLQNDGALEGVGLVIFDEFHERSLHADLALALCREAQDVLRPDLRLLIMSATLDGQQLSNLLGKAPVLTSEGRQHPVTVLYTPPDPDDRLQEAMTKVIRRALRDHEGDILAFLPGAAEIQRTQELLEAQAPGISIHPLYGDLPQAAQQEALMPNRYGLRKVVLATSIAETSLTIEGITVVIDSGFSRVPKFDPRTGLTRLETIKVTQDAAAQRAGRAGRLGPGIAYRLWPEATHRHLAPQRTPEILEADLAPLLLELAQWGVNDPAALCWLTPPPAPALAQARELLQQLGAIQGKTITERGKKMLRLPTHPRLAHLLLEAETLGRIPLAADVAALLEERDPLNREAGADLSLRVEILRQWRRKERVSADRGRLERIERLALAWRKLFNAPVDNAHPDVHAAGQLLAYAYPERIAKRFDANNRRYRLSNGRSAKLMLEHDPLSGEEWLAVAHLDGASGEGKIWMAAPLDPEDLLSEATERETVEWDAQKGELIARKEIRLGEIIVSSTPLKKIPEEQRLQILLDAFRSETWSLLDRDETALQVQARIESLRRWRPEEEWPDCSDAALIERAEDWLAPYLGEVRRRDDFKKLKLSEMLLSLLSWEQQQALEKLAPEKISVPSGSLIKLEYRVDGAAPILAVRLQEVFGLTDTPAINGGRTRLMLHLLSPAYRPVQVTQDLHSFWQNTYPEVRKELRMRYPKHSWPEDPWTAEAVRGAKRRT